jgi:hypothetical protein
MRRAQKKDKRNIYPQIFTPRTEGAEDKDKKQIRKIKNEKQEL